MRFSRKHFFFGKRYNRGWWFLQIRSGWFPAVKVSGSWGFSCWMILKTERCLTEKPKWSRWMIISYYLWASTPLFFHHHFHHHRHIRCFAVYKQNSLHEPTSWNVLNQPVGLVSKVFNWQLATSWPLKMCFRQQGWCQILSPTTVCWVLCHVSWRQHDIGCQISWMIWMFPSKITWNRIPMDT